MNKRIFKTLAAVALFTLVLSTALSLFLNYQFYEKNVQEDMRHLLQVVSYDLEKADDPLVYLAEVSEINPEIRISYFDQAGNPLYDSFVNINTMDNHANRAEIIGASAQKDYQIVRYSNTLATNTFYIATKLSDGNYIRLANEMATVAGVFLNMLPYHFVMALVIFLAALWLSKRATSNILQPLHAYAAHEESVDLAELPEISPFIEEITQQKNTIAAQLGEIKKERDTIGLILENMKEGLLILDSNQRVLMINKQAMKLFQAEDPLNRHVIYITRNEKLLDALEKAYEGEFTSGSFDANDRIMKFYVNPVYLEGEISGALMLLIDETKRMRAEKIREEFSANVSHELKTPLTSIYGFAELLKNDMVADEADRKEIVNGIYEEAQRLLVLIDEIIKISQLEAGDAPMKEAVDLKALSEQIMADFTPKAVAKGVHLAAEGEATVMANPTMMWELLANLTDNAIKYNAAGGTVNIRLEDTPEQVKITVADTGFGIAEDDLERIFERFYRVDKSRFKAHGGSGLGLSIVKHIVKSHDGTLAVSSQLNQGTTITITLPKDI